MSDSKVEIKYDIIVHGKDGLRELLTKVGFVADEQLNTGVTQAGGWGDVRPTLDLLEICIEWMEPILLLRSKDPDLHTRYSQAIDKLLIKRDELINNKRIMHEREKDEIPTR